MNDLERAFYEQIERRLESFGQAVTRHVTDPATDHPYADKRLHDAYVLLNSVGLSPQEIEAIALVAKETAVGVVHSLFVAIDGGAQLGDFEDKPLELINTYTVRPLTSGAFHENFFRYLYGARD